ncbi:hypothetical protein HUG10_19865 (plasmid) [Halorarum halophilum]|uniref:Uncharacterized protein n=1 Tax=Halorarum halophilum TaxID=2743090 RepID=A0A7D5GZV0_9EURY|nr:hypothetical protein [Halobaculum halophilum]QLG29869.1 hypothetical protein HUG10_19865 [Halobaculum halophilum]
MDISQSLAVLSVDDNPDFVELTATVLGRASSRPELIVASNMAFHYRDSEVPSFIDKRLLEISTALLAQLAQALSVPVLVTACSAAADEFTEIIREYADRELQATATSQGIHYEGEEFETEVYWVDGVMQTTIPYWVRLLGVLGEEEEIVESPGQYEAPKLDVWG